MWKIIGNEIEYTNKIDIDLNKEWNLIICYMAHKHPLSRAFLKNSDIKVSENEIDVYAGSKLRKTVSIGLSMFPEDSSSLESVIKNADIALYEAKSKGRNQVVRFQSEQTSSIDLF